ncbi:hypothetical protein [Colwellia sp. MB02u-10]|jgi:hypothetical protein|nr:hypothetical protein [Colwellia sp. MB02u-10]
MHRIVVQFIILYLVNPFNIKDLLISQDEKRKNAMSKHSNT